MNALVAIASNVGLNGEHRMSNGDRAAVAWGVAIAGSACRVVCPEHDLDAATYARALGATLAAWDELRSSAAEITIIGPAAIELGGDELAGRVAERLDAELLFDVLNTQRRHDAWTVTCDAGRGARDVVTVGGPVVLVVSPDVARPKYVSVYRRTRARRAIEPGIQSGPQTSKSIAWQRMTPRTPRSSGAGLADAIARADQAFNMQQDAVATSQLVITDPPPIAAQVLLRFLVHRGFVARSFAGLPPLEAAVAMQPTGTTAPARPVAVSVGGELRIAAATRRGPRLGVDTETRLSRRPRRSSERAARSPPRAHANGLQRGPRRLEPLSQPGLRGPFRIDSGPSTY